MNKNNLTAKYTGFAILSSTSNLLIQKITLTLFIHKHALYLAIVLGTGVGLLTKYYLDSKYIFYYKVKSQKDNFIKFCQYTSMGIVTTLIFWAFELSFNYMFKYDFAKYLGAFIGLVIGYVIKYNLDKRFVFNTAKSTINQNF